MRRRAFISLFGGGLLGGAVAAWPLVALALEPAAQPAGAWRATNECFLTAFVLIVGELLDQTLLRSA